MTVDPHFHPAVHALTLSELETLCEGHIFRKGSEVSITHACAPDKANKGSLVLIGDKHFLAQCQSSENYTIITTQELAADCPSHCAVITATNPRLAFARALQKIYQSDNQPSIASSAKIASSATIGKDVFIGEGAVIEEHASIGDYAILGHYAIIGAHCQIGKKVTVSDHASIYYAKIADNAHIGPHSVIGKEGFGFEMTEKGAIRLPHLGLVEIARNAEIGAHCVIDRGVLGNSVIGENVMIDNHVHIAHNVHIGQNTLILAQVGIAGSAIIGKNVIIGGQVGIKDHITITDNVMVMSGSKVTKSIDKSGAYAGFPAQEAKQHWREMAAIKKLIKKN